MRISGITIPDTKKLEFGLTAIYGIGRTTAVKIATEAGVSLDKKVSEVTPEEENAIRTIIEGMKTEGTLKREISANIKRLKDIKAYRGIRHIRKLPVYGQRTKTNSRTVRGNVRKTMGSGKRKLEKT